MGTKRNRAGMPLSVKLIAATSVVVAVSVGASAYFGQRTIEDLASRQVGDRGTDGRAAIARESDLLAEKVAAATAYSLAQTALKDVQDTLDAEVRGDAHRDQRIEWLMVTDASGQVVAHTRGAPIDRLAQLDATLAAAGPPGVPRLPVVHAQLAPSEQLFATAIVLEPTAPPLGRLRMAITTA